MRPRRCPRFLGRVIDGIDNRRASPLWLQERLRRSGVRAISPVVDVTNYVLLELGQPMHAYDHDRLQQSIHVRHANEGEPLELLDGRRVELTSNMLVIADAAGPVGLAGIMGGARSAVQDTTTRFFESRLFRAAGSSPGVPGVWGSARMPASASERGVDPRIGQRAMERHRATGGDCRRRAWAHRRDRRRPACCRYAPRCRCVASVCSGCSAHCPTTVSSNGCCKASA
ncbi:MAG: B3/4 domain-containing protein [Sinobacteraceae bacterium]|nr:B3/4 domain-containing protein [Nevskiaceae bacterium]